MSPSQPVTCFSSSGTPINKRPVLGYRNLNLFKLYRLVHKLGGFDNVSAAALTAASSQCSATFGHTCLVSMLTDSGSVFLCCPMCEQIESGSVWKQVYQDLGIPVLNSAAGYNVKCAYRKYVLYRRCLRTQLLTAGQMQLLFLSFFTEPDMQFVVCFTLLTSIWMSLCSFYFV